jgi:Tfp pilus assembly protein PilV
MYRKLKIINAKLQRFAGLTLVEVVIASALLIAAMVPILRSLTIAHSSGAKIEHKSRSLLLAQAKLNEIRARSIYNYTNSGSSFAETGTSLYGPYLCNVTDDSGDPLKTITVSVGFDSDGSGGLTNDEVDITLATLIARRWTD